MGTKSMLSGAFAAVFLGTTLVQAAPPPPPKSPQAGTIVIVFKDGHRQSFNLAEIDRVEFPAGAISGDAAGSASTQAPPRGHFIGKWEVGDGAGANFFIILKESGDAERTLNSIHGRWTYVNGEARVTWDDGAMDAIRKVGSHYQKSAYAAGKSFTDTPDNVDHARLVTEKPI